MSSIILSVGEVLMALKIISGVTIIILNGILLLMCIFWVKKDGSGLPIGFIPLTIFGNFISIPPILDLLFGVHFVTWVA